MNATTTTAQTNATASAKPSKAPRKAKATTAPATEATASTPATTPAAPEAPAATPAPAPVAKEKKPSKCGEITRMLDAATTPAPMTIREIIKALADMGFKDANTPQTISSINAIAVPSWGRNQGKLFRYAVATQQGEVLVNTTTETIQGIAPGARLTNTSLQHTFGPDATGPVKMDPAAWQAIPEARKVPQPKVAHGQILEAAAKAAKAAAKASGPATVEAAAPAPSAAPAEQAAPAKAPAASATPGKGPGKAPAQKKAAKAPTAKA